jgi:DNA polymerase III epsilon subunit-like protein
VAITRLDAIGPGQPVTTGRSLDPHKAPSLSGWWCDERLRAAPLSWLVASGLALDTETTGLDRTADRLIEIAVVRIRDGQPVFLWTREDSPVTELAAASLARRAIGARPVCIHNATFDLGFLRATAGEWGGRGTPRWLCTWRAHGAGPSLDELAATYGVVASRRHRALPDAVLLAAVVRRMIGRPVMPGATVDDLSRLACPAPVPLLDPIAAVIASLPHRVPARPIAATARKAARVLRESVAESPTDPVAVLDALEVAIAHGVLRSHLVP